MYYGSKEKFNFRDITDTLVFVINDNRNLRFLSLEFECDSRVNAYLAYGYIDHQAGITFEVLCLAEITSDGNYKLRRGNSKTSTKLRYDSINGTLMPVPMDGMFIPTLYDKIETIEKYYQVNSGIQKARRVKALDHLRHQQFPDDIVVMFYINDHTRPEGIWCRVEDCTDRQITVTLLDSPYHEIGIHGGDQIQVELMNTDNGVIAVPAYMIHN